MNPYEAPQSITPRATVVKEHLPEAPRRRGLGYYFVIGILVVLGLLFCLALISPIFYTTLQYQRIQEERQKQSEERNKIYISDPAERRDSSTRGIEAG